MNIAGALAGLTFDKTDIYVGVAMVIMTSLLWIAVHKGSLPTLSGLIQAWSDFTDTLNGRGGTIGLLFIASFILGIMVLRSHHLGIDAESASTIRTTFSGFTGALLIALTSKDKNGNGNGSPPPPPPPPQSATLQVEKDAK